MMPASPRRRTSAAIFAVLLLAGAAAAGTPGTSGFLSLRNPVGAREAAMGGAGVASADGAAAVYWNPARLAFATEGTDLLLQHQRLWGLFDKETAAVAHRTPYGTLGFIFSGLYADEIERYEEDGVGVPLGTFRPYEVALGVSYARRFGEAFAAGVGVKLLHTEIDVYGDTGLAYDLFIAHRAEIPGLWFGASLTNLGPDLNLNDAPFALPQAGRLGLAYDPQQAFFAGRLTLAADVLFPNDGNEKAHVGAEFRLVPALALRLGTRVNYESQGYTWGAGFNRGPLTLGYAFEQATNDLGDWHRFALELALGRAGY
ncbi:MAG: PorV/PorQ family protein [bacterium]|nr:PorV/PorQ family protein [bacterium]